jgi:serine/threonine protein kinase
MAAPVQDASAFLALVAKSGLIAEDALADQFDGDLFEKPAQAAEFMVKQGVLTAFQARVLLAGKHKGLVLGPYKILDQLGRGGMGIVYLAEHEKLQCKRAIKVLPKENTSDALALDRFYREARAVAALDHPNIVKAYDVAEADGVHYFVMEYVQGVNLQTHLQQKGPLPWKPAVGFVAQACKGLQHAHERGMVHRDIKPGNLLVDRQGILKILDLGLARCFKNEKDNLTGKYGDSSDEFMGSVDFMAPEVALGDQAVDIRTDIYSLGVTLFSLVVGKPPFEGSPAQKLMHHQLRPVPPLHEFQPEVPETLSAVIARMTHKRVDQRYPTPASVFDALAPWLGSASGARAALPQPTVLPPTPPPTQRIERQAVRDTRPIHAEDTQANSPITEETGHTTRRRRRRFKKKRSSSGYSPALFVVVPLLLLLLGGGIWGIVALVNHYSNKPSTQMAAAAPNRTPSRPAEDTPPPQSSENPPPIQAPDNSPPNRPNPSGPPRRPTRPPTQPPTQPGNPGITGPMGPSGPGGSDVQSPPVGEGVEVGQQAPEIASEDLDGVEFLLSDYRGKVVLLDFWGFW